MAHKLPDSWASCPLDQITQIVGGGTPARETPAFWIGGDIPWITPTDITGQSGRVLNDCKERITNAGLRASSAKLLPAGTLLMTSRATLAEIKIAAMPVTINQGFKNLIPSEQVDGWYLYYQMLFRKEQYARLGIGSTFLEVSKKDTARFEVPVPLKKEQAAIAKVLASIDDVIRETEAIIAKLQAVKQGLLHDLLTRGLDANGQLRPPPALAPQLYQDSPLGLIPREWEVKRCMDLCSRICVGIVIQPTKYYEDEGVPAFRSANVREGSIDPSNFVHISPASNQLLAKSQVKAGDVLTVRTGYPGTSAVVPPEFEGANCIDIIISTPGSQLLPEYLCEWINSSFGKGQVLRQQGGMAQQHFNVGEMQELLVALPPINEQIKIWERIKSIAEKLALEQSILSKMHHQKSGLMDDLLTGRVRVKVAETEKE